MMKAKAKPSDTLKRGRRAVNDRGPEFRRRLGEWGRMLREALDAGDVSGRSSEVSGGDQGSGSPGGETAEAEQQLRPTGKRREWSNRAVLPPGDRE